MRSRAFKLLIPILAIGLIATGCKKSTGGETSKTTTILGQTANDHGTKDVGGASSIEVEMDDFYFNPTILKGPAGQSITLELKNEGSNTHNLSITEQNVDTDVASDKTGEVDVTFPDSGQLLFFCKFHASSNNMRGGLEVA